MAGERDLDMQIVIRAITDEASAEDATKKLTKKVLSSLKDGCVEIPAVVADPFEDGKTSKKLLEAQQALISKWKKMSREGFSASTRELDDFISSFTKFRKTLNKEKPKSSRSQLIKELDLNRIVKSYTDDKKAISSKKEELGIIKSSKSSRSSRTAKAVEKQQRRELTEEIKDTRRRIKLSKKYIREYEKSQRESEGLERITKSMSFKENSGIDEGATTPKKVDESDRGGPYGSQFASQNARSEAKFRPVSRDSLTKKILKKSTIERMTAEAYAARR